MELIKKSEMSMILGGYDEEKCKALQKQAQEGFMTTEEWERWIDLFEMYCV